VSFTAITITGSFERPNGEPAQGSVTATLSETIQNGTETIEPNPVMGVLNQEGKLVAESLEAFKLEANDDTGTTPAGSTYTFLVELDTAPIRSFTAVVPHTASEGKIDLTVLEG
jgi:hypothetical protein